VKRLHAGWVVPVVGPPLRDGVVAVDGGRVAWIGPAGEGPAGEDEDLGAGVLLPGFVNAHTHLELSHLAGTVGPAPFVPWVRALIAARAGETPESVRAAARMAIASAAASGTSAVGDVSNGLQHLGDLAQSRLRAVVFHELIGWDPVRAEEALAWSRARRAELPELPGLEVRLAAHAPYSCSPRLLSLMAAAGGPAAIHLAESAAESRFLADGGGEFAQFLAERGLGHVAFAGGARSPVDHAEACGILHPGLVIAHGVQTDAADHALLAGRGVHVALCPRSNLALGNGLPPLPALLAAGVQVALGTDSLASAPSLDLLAEALELHRAFPAVEPAALVRAATLGGAAALGLADHGRIAPGARAAFAYVAAERRPPEPLAHVLSGASATGLFYDQR
jgi:cytosine/adenosine deaminase-related metal-dependent hydrolase